MVEGMISASEPRRRVLQLAGTALAIAVFPRALLADQRDEHTPATQRAASVAAFEEVWQTVRDRFYDPHLHGLDWPAMRERYLPEAARATSGDMLASVINSMLSELHASHTRYYTPDEPEYYQLADIFAGALRRSGLERAFPRGRSPIPASASSRAPRCKIAAPSSV